MCSDSITSGLGCSHIYFRYNATSGDNVDNTVEQLDIENMDVGFGILFLAVLCPKTVLLPVWRWPVSQ